MLPNHFTMLVVVVVVVVVVVAPSRTIFKVATSSTLEHALIFFTRIVINMYL
jgi:hypothetical protein